MNNLAVAAAGTGGGVIGALFAFALLKTIGRVGAVIVFVALLLIGLLLAFQTSLSALAGHIGRFFSGLGALLAFRRDTSAEPRQVTPPDVQEAPRRATSPAAARREEGRPEQPLPRNPSLRLQDEPLQEEAAPLIEEKPLPAEPPPPKKINLCANLCPR